MNRDIQKRIADMVDTLCAGNKSEFCRRIGRSNSSIKDIVGSKHLAPGFDLLYDILSSDLGISPKWLMLGEGPMLEREAQTATPPQANIHNNQVFIGNWEGLASALVEVIKSQSK